MPLWKCWTLDARYVSGVQRPAFAQRFRAIWPNIAK
jgi:hypothetical protein